MANDSRLRPSRLARIGFHQQKWVEHKDVLLNLFTELLEQGIQGLLLNEVGNMSDLITVRGKKRLELVLEEAFEKVGATEQGPPQFFWSEGETMAAFRCEVKVRYLKPLTRINRVIERFEVFGAIEHGSGSMLI